MSCFSVHGEVRCALHSLNMATLLLYGICMYGMHYADCAKPTEQNFCVCSYSEVSGKLCMCQSLCMCIQLLGRHYLYSLTSTEFLKGGREEVVMLN